jgi:phosphatidylglycerophosphate synthase
MFSIRALDNASARQRSWGACLLYAKESVNGSLANIRACRTLSFSIVRSCSFGNLAVLAFLSAIYAPSEPILITQIAVYGTAACALLSGVLLLNVGRLRDGSPNAKDRLGMANTLTIIRMVLVVPLVLLVLHAKFVTALATYVVCLVTDVLDGAIARTREEPTEFGTIVDPLADILSTAGLYGAFLSIGVLPLWVYAILAIRYLSLFAGCAALFFIKGRFKIRATPVGKIVGVLQGLAGIMILALASSELQWQDTIGVTLFPFLGIIFGSVIVSQLLIGVRHIRKGARGA